MRILLFSSFFCELGSRLRRFARIAGNMLPAQIWWHPEGFLRRRCACCLVLGSGCAPAGAGLPFGSCFADFGLVSEFGPFAFFWLEKSFFVFVG